MSLNFLATRFTCTWPWSTLVMLCDGRIVCGCADPYGHRVLGDARVAGISEIWKDTTISALRADLNAGGSKFCGDCPLKLPLKSDPAPVRSLDVARLPSRMYIECTAACNISCTEACCAPETGITKTRQTGMLDFDLFKRVVDEAGSDLGRIDFFNYGEAFLHKRAIEMCEYIKSRFPHIYLYTSTNGLMFTEDSARRLARSGIDEVTFSIDGASQGTYEKYRQRGRFDIAIRNLRAMADEKQRLRRDLPVLNWRYILFTWNDSDEEMDRARKLAMEIGIDRLSWEITDHPENAYSRRFTPGTPAFESIRQEIWDTSNLGNAIPGATPRARIEVKQLFRPRPLKARAAARVMIKTQVENACKRPFPAQATYGRRLVRLGAQLCDENGNVLERDFARAWLPDTIEPGERMTVPIQIVAPKVPGRYALKFDLVSEGIDWFEACGSPTTVKELVVK
ncbi:MAG: radical SAM protein [Vicinamibacterales bacterium]|nr:radical SAM protein [Vicinamibacterales bacterium]